jgi:diguanylate cyclase (GGDEF)-like protein/PAS domain S-box-containing protein
MFRLKRYFSIVGLVAFIATATALTLFYRHTTTQQLIELNESNYLDLTQTIVNTLWPSYRTFLKDAESLSKEELAYHPTSGALHEDVLSMLHGLPVLKIKIFSPYGKTVFSSDSEQNGEVKSPGYPGRIVANTGKVFSKIAHNEKIKTITGSYVSDRDVLSSYYPIRAETGKRVENVIEIYTDVTDTLAVIEHKQFVVAGVVLVILSLFYIILYVFISRAEKILLHQRNEYHHATGLSSRLGRLLDRTTNEIYIFDSTDYKFIQVNQGALENLGYNMEEMSEMHPWDLKPQFSREEFLAYIESLDNGGLQQMNFETVHERKDGSVYPVEVRLQLSHAEEPPVYVAMVLDISERKQSERDLRKLSSAIEQSYNSVVITDPEGKVEYVNPKFTELTGYTAAEVLGKKPDFWQSGDTAGGIYAGLWETIQGGNDWHGELKNRKKDGTSYWVAESISPLRDESGEITHYICMLQDITYQKDAKDQLNYLAHYDSLTRLPNRRLLGDRLLQAMKDSDRNERLLAVMFIDLDHFKNVNDSLGHEAGDILLREASTRLKKCVRENDTVARLGGDEFTLILNGLNHANNAVNVAEKVLEEFSWPFHINNLSLCVTVSIGITMYPFDNNNVEGILRNADTAMYHAKNAGRNNFKFYNHEMTARAEKRLAMENELRQALKRGEFVLHYQPQINTRSGRIEGMEALVRWQQPERGLIGPNEFISIAEEAGLIVPIGEWVLREACRRNRDLQVSGLDPISVSVNVSASQFRDPNLVEMVDHVLKDTGLEPSLLNLEITESMLMSDVDNAARVLKELSGLGVTIAIDDFGTGYSSLSYLKRFPISTLKIDRSFVRDIPENKDDMLIIRAIISMANGLGINTVAEGVETREQLNFLKFHKCNLIQGFYFNKPLAYDDLVALLRDGQSHLLPMGMDSAG